MKRQEQIKYHRSRSLPRVFLIDDNLDDHSLDELRTRAARKVNFVVIDFRHWRSNYSDYAGLKGAPSEVARNSFES
jgi:hypothetical protein